MPTAAVMLMALAIGLYVYDSTLLLYANEAVLCAGKRDRWRIAFGSERARLLGRQALLLDLLAPHRPVFRLMWRFEGGDGGTASAQWPQIVGDLRPLAPFVAGMAVALFVVLPLGLFTSLGLDAVLAALGLLYASIMIALGWLYYRRARLGLAGGKFAALAFESLACPPFALNLVRRIAAGQTVDEDLPTAARRLLAPEDWAAARSECLARIDEEIEGEDEQSGRLAALQANRRRFLPEASA